MMHSKILILLCFLFCSCVSHESSNKRKKISVPVGSYINKSELVTKAPSRYTAEPNASKGADCIPFQRHIDRLPFYVSEKDVVINKILSPCFDSQQNPGYLPSTNWTAMGFPCTGGKGAFDWKGSPRAPKLLLFTISNSCPMKPRGDTELKQSIQERLGLLASANMMAYYPFSVFFWELQDGSDADTSFTIEVVSKSRGKNRWHDYLKGDGIPVRLYGKPNAFLPMREWYEVMAVIKRESATTFYLDIENVRTLTEDDVDQVKSRCQDLRPRRRCNEIF